MIESSQPEAYFKLTGFNRTTPQLPVTNSLNCRKLVARLIPAFAQILHRQLEHQHQYNLGSDWASLWGIYLQPWTEVVAEEEVSTVETKLILIIISVWFSCSFFCCYKRELLKNYSRLWYIPVKTILLVCFFFFFPKLFSCPIVSE